MRLAGRPVRGDGDDYLANLWVPMTAVTQIVLALECSVPFSRRRASPSPVAVAAPSVY